MQKVDRNDLAKMQISGGAEKGASSSSSSSSTVFISVTQTSTSGGGPLAVRI